MLTPPAGTVALDGRPLADWTRRELARRIAVVPQETHAPFDFSVLDIVLMGRYPHLGAFELEGPADLAIARRRSRRPARRRFEDAAVRDAERRREAARRHRQRAGAGPELLLLDEPTASLDLGYQLEIAALLRRLNRDRGVDDGRVDARSEPGRGAVPRV